MMTVIEQRTMDAIQSINRKMKDRSGIDWEQRLYETAKDDCFIAGYKTCFDELFEPEAMIPLPNRHLKDQQLVEDGIKMTIGYADLRRGYTEDEKAEISRANEVADALKKLIEACRKERNNERD